MPDTIMGPFKDSTEPLVGPGIHDYYAQLFRTLEIQPTESSRVNTVLGNPVYLMVASQGKTENDVTMLVSRQSSQNIAGFLEEIPNGNIFPVFNGASNPYRQDFKDADVIKLVQDLKEILQAGGFVMSESTVSEAIAARPKPSITKELAERFDAVVEMGEQVTLEKGRSVATDTLRSCLGTFIDNPATITFSHYRPSETHNVRQMLKEHVTPETHKVHFMAPGIAQTDMDGKKSVVFDPEYTNDYDFRSAVAEVKTLGVECVFHCYEKLHTDVQKTDPANRYKGTSWVTREGVLFLDNVQVTGNQPAEPFIAQQAAPKTSQVVRVGA